MQKGMICWSLPFLYCCENDHRTVEIPKLFYIEPQSNERTMIEYVENRPDDPEFQAILARTKAAKAVGRTMFIQITLFVILSVAGVTAFAIHPLTILFLIMVIPFFFGIFAVVAFILILLHNPKPIWIYFLSNALLSYISFTLIEMWASQISWQ